MCFKKVPSGHMPWHFFSPTLCSPVEALLLAPPVVHEALVDVVAGLLLAPHQLQPQARVVGVVVQVQADVAGLDGLQEGWGGGSLNMF